MITGQRPRVADVISAALVAAGLHVAGHGDTLTVEHQGEQYRVIVEQPNGERRTNATYQDWCQGESYNGETFPPLNPGHPAYNQECLLCLERLGNGLPVQIHIIGPVGQEARYKHYTGERYAPVGVFLHERCASGEPRPKTPTTE